MTFQQFIDKYKGKGVDFDGYYGDQCVDLFRQYVKEVLNQPQPRAIKGAKDFWTNYSTDANLKNYFQKIPNTPSGVPEKGDVMIWGSTYGRYGHIAIVNWANVNQFQALSQNDPIGSKTALKNYSYNHILGWLKPLKTNNKDMTDYQKLYDEARKARDLYWNESTQLIRSILGDVKITDNEADNDYYVRQIDRATEEHARLKKKLADNAKTCQKQLDTVTSNLNGQISELKSQAKDIFAEKKRLVERLGEAEATISTLQKKLLEKTTPESQPEIQMTWQMIFQIIKNKLLGE